MQRTRAGGREWFGCKRPWTLTKSVLGEDIARCSHKHDLGAPVMISWNVHPREEYYQRLNGLHIFFRDGGCCA